MRASLSSLARWLLLVLLLGPAESGSGSPRSSAEACATPDSFAAADPLPARQRERILSKLGVDRWHSAGFRGRGIKIAVLDTGFRGYRAHLGGALPAHVTARSFRSDAGMETRDSQHGVLCAEVLHTLAPDADLLLATWEPDRSDQFLAAVRWSLEQGAQVLSCSIIMPSWSDGEGGGPVHAELKRLFDAGRLSGRPLLFASAGNTAQRHWCGAYHEGSAGWHEWEAGECDNPILPWAGERVSVECCWRAGADYDLFVWDDTLHREIGRSCSRGDHNRACAVVPFQPEPSHAYVARVRSRSGTPSDFHLVVLGGGLGHATARRSIPFPGDGPEVVAVGAVDPEGQRKDYSSCGPNPTSPKPDLVATVPFPSQWRARPFSGTSAAAPQAAGLATLLWSRHPEWTAAQVRAALRDAADDLGPPGHDCETGYGLIRLP
jgi:hypothetical protein